MNTVVDNAVCRCCSSEGAFKNIKGKYIWMGEEETYIDMLKDCYDIQIIIPEKLNHDLESGICELCITQLRNALNFRKQVLTTEEVFRKRFSDKIQLCESNCIKIEEPSDGLHDDDDGVVDALDFDINVSEVHEYEVPVKEEESEGEVSRSKRSKRTTRSSTIKIKRSKLDRAETSKCDSKKNDEKLQQKVKHLIKKKSKIKSEQDDDWTVSISKKADSDQGEQSGSLVGTVVKFLKPTKGFERAKRIITIGNNKSLIKLKMVRGGTTENHLNLTQILHYSNASPIKKKVGAGYTCEYCDEIYAEPRLLKTHYLENHKDNKATALTDKRLFRNVVKLDITNLTCTICSKSIPQLMDLMVHLSKEHKKKMHLDIKHDILPFSFETDSFRCSICSIEKTTFKLLQEHMNMHFRNYVCSVCNVGFVRFRLLKSHLRRHGNSQIKCDQCDRVFVNEAKKLEHIRRSHMGFGHARNKCHQCGQRFVDYWKKVDHQVAVHGMPPIVLKCHACDREFDNQRKLTRHIKKYHLMEKKFKCADCDMTFFDSGGLKKHTLKHTGLKLFKCDVCFKSYGLKKTLREHMRIHNNDRRFSCAHCGQMFIQKCSWRAHMRSKHGELV